MKDIKALGESVVITAIAKSAGTEEISSTGIVISTQRVEGEIPQLGEIYSIGEGVPKGYFEIGDVVPLPNGNMRNVPHPETVFNNKKAKEVDQKFITAHYRTIAAVYK